MAKIDPVFLEQTRQEYLRRYSERPRAASQWLREVAERNMIHYATLHRHLKLCVRGSKEPSQDVALRHSEENAYAQMVWRLVQEKSHGDSRMRVKVVYDHLRSEGRIPEEITIKRIYEAMKRLNLRNDAMPITQRFERKTPMSMWQMDFSKSRYIKHVSDKSGESAVEIRDPQFTKRQDDGKSLWFGVAVDDASRVIYVEYFVARGESSDEVIEFVLHAFDPKPAMLLQGIPESIFVDRGSGWMDGRTAIGLKKMGVKEIVGANAKDALGRTLNVSNKAARGKVERTVRTMKEVIEARLYLKYGHGHRMPVAELNAVVSAMLEEFNQERHPTRRDDSKWNIYQQTIGSWIEDGFQKLRYPADDARALFSRSITKTVIRRKINLGKGIEAVVPSFIDDGAKVEVVRSQAGKGWFLFHDGKLIELAVDQPRSEDEQLARTPVRAEVKTTMLADLALRRRFDQALLAALGTTLQRLSDDEYNDIAPFFEKPHSIEEIEEQVAWMKSRRSIVAEAKAPKAPTPISSNIIMLPKESYRHEK